MNSTSSKFSRYCFVLGAAITLAGCGSSGSGSSNSTSPPPATVSVSLNQTSASVTAGSTVQFSATVQGTSNTSVTWSVDSVNGGNSSVGTISSSGLCTAPTQTGNHTVAATSVADSSKSATAAVTITPPPQISLSPGSATVASGQTQQFSATITGTSITTVNWSVDQINGGNSTVGTISSSGLYTADRKSTRLNSSHV